MGNVSRPIVPGIAPPHEAMTRISGREWRDGYMDDTVARLAVKLTAPHQESEQSEGLLLQE